LIGIALAAIGLIIAVGLVVTSVPHTEGFWGFIGVLVGAVVTGSVTLGGELVKGRNDDRLDSKKRQDDRRIVSDAFQRENLLALQDAMDALTAREPDVLGEDLASIRASGSLQSMSDKLFNEYTALDARVRHLMQRVLDDELRSLIDEYRTISFENMIRRNNGLAADRAYAEGMTSGLADKAADIDERLSEVLRALLSVR
jgi:hypothetical protein